MTDIRTGRAYDKSLADILARSGREQTANGAHVIVKDIPDLSGEGNLDPRVYADITSQSGRNSGNPNEAINLNLQGVDFDVDKILLYLRARSDEARRNPEKKKTVNLCEKEIIAEKEEFISCGRKTGIWRYESDKNAKGRACYIHFHGGGFFHGAPMGNDDMLAYIAEKSGSVVFDVDYALAPEYKFPAALDDCYNALNHVYENADLYGIDRRKIAIGGESAGGNLAAAVALKERDENGKRIALMFPLNPATMQTSVAIPAGYVWNESDYDFSGTANILRGTLTAPEDSVGLNVMFKAFIGDHDAADPYVSPSMASDFSDLPKAIITTAEYDVLRGQGEFFGGQLQKAGVDAKVIRYRGLRHEDIGYFGVVPQSEDLANIIISELKKL